MLGDNTVKYLDISEFQNGCIRLDKDCEKFKIYYLIKLSHYETIATLPLFLYNRRKINLYNKKRDQLIRRK